MSWLADALGGVRDIEVLRARLPRTAAADLLAPLPMADVDLMDALLASRQTVAWDALDTVLASERYLALLDLLVDAASQPPLRGTAGTSGAKTLPRIASAVAAPGPRRSGPRPASRRQGVASGAHPRQARPIHR